jgi:hypothetical protein
MANAEAAGRVGEFKAHPGVPVHTFWDIGRRDYTSIWFAQVFAGKVRAVGFYQNCLTGMPHYAEYCFGTDHIKKALPTFISPKNITGIFDRMGWIRGTDVFPHDAEVIEWGSDRSRIEQLKHVGFNPTKAVDLSLHDGINAGRGTIDITEFDAEDCSEGIKVLKLYRWEWDDQRGAWKTGTERHDVNSHGAAAWRYLGTSHREMPAAIEPRKELPTHQAITTNEDGSLTLAAAKASDIIAIRKRLKEMQRG